MTSEQKQSRDSPVVKVVRRKYVQPLQILVNFDEQSATLATQDRKITNEALECY